MEVFQELAALPLQQLLGLGVIGALVTTAGTLIALVLKEVVMVRSFERWKQRRQLEAIYGKYRDPLILAAIELAIRCREISDGLAQDYLDRALLDAMPAAFVRNWAGDPYYRRYKFQSTVYRVCALFAWMELYRQDIVFLQSGRARHTRELGERVETIREDLADGQLNIHWSDSVDGLIFREEQRAIGEAMIVTKGEKRLVMGYGEFTRLMAEPAYPEKSWIDAAVRFLDGLGARGDDFRPVRIKRLFIHLVDLVRALDSRRVWPNHHERREKYWSELPDWARERPSIQEKRRRVSEVVAAAGGATQ